MKLRQRITERFGTQEKFSAAAGIPEAIVSKIVHRLRQPTRTQKEIFYNLPGFQFEQFDRENIGALFGGRKQ